jgi:Tol biopolymer transport system component/tRNA A-37 threonylcarbamoyl transferase component Bud32
VRHRGRRRFVRQKRRGVSESQPFGEPDTVAPGTRVGRYSIVEKIGEGGEAIVYRARDDALERDVALKTPRRGFGAARDNARLLREARAASRLSHPCIVPIYEVFEHEGRPWFAMGLVEGATLRSVLRQRGALPAEDVARYGEMLADALRAAHAKRVLHRDVTPANIFITPDGRLLLADFGMAHVPPDPDAYTVTISGEQAAGTLGYMSPEQMMGREVGPQSDIFSAGVVLYQMATGDRPFGGSSLGEVLDAVLNRDVPPLSTAARVPADLEYVIRKALARRLDERYAKADDLFVDLRALRRRLESGTTGPVFAPPSRRWTRKRAVAWAGAAAALMALAALGVGAWRLTRSEGLPTSVPFQVTSASGWEAEAKISPAGSDIAYVAEGADGNVDIWLVDARGGNPIRITDDPAPDRHPAWFPDGSAIAFASERGEVSGVWKVPRLGGQSPTPILSAAGSPAISPDGSRVAFTRLDAGGTRRIAVAPLRDTSAVTILTTASDGLWNHDSPAWSPDGRTICYSTQTDLWTVDAAGGKPQRLTKEGEADFEPAWSADGRWVYFTSMRGQTTAIWRVPAGGGAAERVTMGSGPERQPSLSLDGTKLVYSTFNLNSNLVVRDIRTGREVEFGGERRELYPAFAPDASAIVYVSDQVKSPPDLWIQPLSADGSPAGQARRLTDHPGTAAYPSYSPDGRWIAYHRALEGRRGIWIVPAAGGPPAQFTTESAVDIHPVWSPDGRTIAFVSERGGGSHIWLAPVADGKPAGPARQLTDGPDSHDQPAWSPDSATLAYVAIGAAGTGEVWLVDAKAGGPGRQLTHGAGADVVAWGASPDQLLVSGAWGSSRLQLMRVDAATGRAVPALPPNPFGSQADSGDFAISRDGRLLVIVRQAAKGDVWLLEATRGRY